jgi:hypothetical protein
MPKLYKINAEEISKLVSESKKPKSKKQKLVNSQLPPKKLPKIEKAPLIRTEAKLPSPEPSEPIPEPVREPTPEPVREPTLEPVREPTPEPVREPTPEPVKPVVNEVVTQRQPYQPMEEEPPKWFQKFVLQVKEEQEKQAREAGERKVPQRIIKEEAEQIAQERWQDPRIREKVETKISKNLQSIYSMVFPNRQY